jgi:hypothetical protein
VHDGSSALMETLQEADTDEVLIADFAYLTLPYVAFCHYYYSITILPLYYLSTTLARRGDRETAGKSQLSSQLRQPTLLYCTYLPPACLARSLLLCTGSKLVFTQVHILCITSTIASPRIWQTRQRSAVHYLKAR